MGEPGGEFGAVSVVASDGNLGLNQRHVVIDESLPLVRALPASVELFAPHIVTPGTLDQHCVG